MTFDEDKFKNDRLMLAEKLMRRMNNELIPYDGEVLHNLAYVLAESQQWAEVTALLRAQESTALCQPYPKTANYLKQNLVYIFQN